jgi:hypothetical protein
MRTIKTYFKGAPFYNAFIGRYTSHIIPPGQCRRELGVGGLAYG